MSSRDAGALLRFEPNGFRILRAGTFVVCAVSGQPVPLEELRYWCVERQEAYASPDLATRRLLDQA